MADPDEQRDVFLRRIGEALSPYQLIEEYLKMYIQAAHLEIQGILLGRQIPFRYPRSEYENAPLERLITMFRRHSDNEDLIKRLRGALKKRNYIAHNVIARYMEHREKNPAMAQSISEDLEKMKDDGYDLVEELANEFNKLKSS
jgi:hypothetical protein